MHVEGWQPSSPQSYLFPFALPLCNLKDSLLIPLDLWCPQYLALALAEISNHASPT